MIRNRLLLTCSVLLGLSMGISPDSLGAVARMTGALDPQIAQIASLSPTLASELGALEAGGWIIVTGPASGGYYFSRGTKTITVNNGVYSPAVTVGCLAHEIGHALAVETEYHSTAGLTREQYINQNVDEKLNDEGAAQFNAATVRDEIARAGGPDIGIPGRQPEAYQVIYAAFVAGRITRADAITRMSALMGDELTSNTVENYRAYYSHDYADIWDAEKTT